MSQQNSTVPSVVINVKGHELHLLGQKGIWWAAKKILIIADTHLGKAVHFRKAGLAVPQEVETTNYDLLARLINELGAESVIFVGDLFHSERNYAVDYFARFRRAFPATSFILVKGNHDTLSPDDYKELGLVATLELRILQISFIHEFVAADAEPGAFYISGHLHPAIKMKGKGRQRIVAPCFWLQPQSLILPSFGEFTGKFQINPKKDNRVFAVVNQQVIEVEAQGLN